VYQNQVPRRGYEYSQYVVVMAYNFVLFRAAVTERVCWLSNDELRSQSRRKPMLEREIVTLFLFQRVLFATFSKSHRKRKVKLLPAQDTRSCCGRPSRHRRPVYIHVLACITSNYNSNIRNTHLTKEQTKTLISGVGYY